MSQKIQARDEEIDFLIRENQRLQEKLREADYQIIALTPRQSGWLYTLKVCDKRTIALGTISFLITASAMVGVKLIEPIPLFMRDILSVLFMVGGWYAYELLKKRLPLTSAEKKAQLLHAIDDQDITRLRQLIAAGADVNAPLANGQSALWRALQEPYSSEIAIELVNAGVDLNIKREYGDSYLHAAVMLGDALLVRLLLEKGMKPNAPGRWGKTALHDAVHGDKANLAIVKLLIAGGADINACASWGHTPLHYAIADKQTAIMEHLIGLDEDCEAEATWLTEHHYYNGHYDIVRLMIDLEESSATLRRTITPGDLYDELEEIVA